jgi:prepilin-type N-terminal cleavage/methylation domain-containing protein
MTTSGHHPAAGFTLIEMLIVTTLIGVLAGVAVPNLISSRANANEAAVIATLRAITTAQFQFQTAGELDQDSDSGFEFATLGELGALDPLRGTGVPLSKNLLSASVATVDGSGWVQLHGYRFCLYLPDTVGLGVVGLPANAGTIDPGQSRRYWTCLAWPNDAATSGRRTFFVNQQGQVLKTLQRVYSGAGFVPPAGAGLMGVSPGRIDSQFLATDTVGADGHRWAVVH